MRKFSLLLLSGLFFGIASYVERNKYDPQIGDDSQKGPPGIKTVDLAYLNATDRNSTNDGSSDYIILFIQMKKGNIDELSDAVEYRTTTYIKKLNQSVGYKINDSI
jgi:hypothetical protein